MRFIRASSLCTCHPPRSTMIGWGYKNFLLWPVEQMSTSYSYWAHYHLFSTGGCCMKLMNQPIACKKRQTHKALLHDIISCLVGCWRELSTNFSEVFNEELRFSFRLTMISTNSSTTHKKANTCGNFREWFGWWYFNNRKRRAA